MADPMAMLWERERLARTLARIGVRVRSLELAPYGYGLIVTTDSAIVELDCERRGDRIANLFRCGVCNSPEVDDLRRYGVLLGRDRYVVVGLCSNCLSITEPELGRLVADTAETRGRFDMWMTRLERRGAQ